MPSPHRPSVRSICIIPDDKIGKKTWFKKKRFLKRNLAENLHRFKNIKNHTGNHTQIVVDYTATLHRLDYKTGQKERRTLYLKRPAGHRKRKQTHFGTSDRCQNSTWIKRPVG
jgi:hypothetical protein